MLKKLIVGILSLNIFFNVSYAATNISCPDNKEVFIAKANGVIQFVAPVGAENYHNAPYASIENFNAWASRLELKASNVISYDPVTSSDEYGYGVICQYNLNWLSMGHGSGNVPVIIFYCGGKQCPY